MDDHQAMLAIQEQLDGVEWSSDTLDRIASILIGAGYRIRDTGDVDRDDLAPSPAADLAPAPTDLPWAIRHGIYEYEFATFNERQTRLSFRSDDLKAGLGGHIILPNDVATAFQQSLEILVNDPAGD